MNAPNFDPSICHNEDEVISKFVVSYLLPQLGYGPELWHQEVRQTPTRLDFLVMTEAQNPLNLKQLNPPLMVVEAKSPRKNLDHHRYQLWTYLRQYEARFGMLTNGRELQLYERQSQDEVALIFECQAAALDEKLDELRQLVGKTALTPKPTLQKERVMQTIAVYHNKGGVGKTTVSVNLAAAFARMKKRVLLIDLDAQANATFATGLIKFQTEEEDTIIGNYVYHLIKSPKTQIDKIRRPSDKFNGAGGQFEITVIPSHIKLMADQHELNSISAAKLRLREKLAAVASEYDYAIIDAPPSRDLYAEIALVSADYLLIPSDLKPFANQGLKNVKEYLEEVDSYRQQIGKPKLQVLGIVPSRILNNARFLEYTFPKQKQSVIQHYGLPIFDTVIHDHTALSSCFNDHLEADGQEIPMPKSIFAFYETTKATAAGQAAENFEFLAAEVTKRMQLGSVALSKSP